MTPYRTIRRKLQKRYKHKKYACCGKCGRKDGYRTAVTKLFDDGNEVAVVKMCRECGSVFKWTWSGGGIGRRITGGESSPGKAARLCPFESGSDHAH